MATYMGYLWRGARFQIVDSEVTAMNGGNAFLVLESARLRMRVVNDRDQLLLSFQPTFARSDRQAEWTSVELVKSLIEAAPAASGVLDPEHAEFVGSHLDTIEEYFSPERWPGTKVELEYLKKARARDRGW